MESLINFFTGITGAVAKGAFWFVVTIVVPGTSAYVGIQYNIKSLESEQQKIKGDNEVRFKSIAETLKESNQALSEQLRTVNNSISELTRAVGRVEGQLQRSHN